MKVRDIACKPALFTAHRGDTDEGWRVERLERIFLHAAERATDQRAWVGSVVALHEREGTLTVKWRRLEDAGRFAGAIKCGWNREGEYAPVKHQVDRQAAAVYERGQRSRSRSSHGKTPGASEIRRSVQADA